MTSITGDYSGGDSDNGLDKDMEASRRACILTGTNPDDNLRPSTATSSISLPDDNDNNNNDEDDSVSESESESLEDDLLSESESNSSALLNGGSLNITVMDIYGHLVDKRTGTPGDWSYIIKQIGMFTFPGLNSKQVIFMTKEYHIYMTSDWHISMAGLSSQTVPHLADAIHATITTVV